MALNLSMTRPYASIERPVHPDFSVEVEGQFLVGYPNGSETAVGPSSESVTTALFEGIARMENIQQRSKVEAVDTYVPVEANSADTHVTIKLDFAPASSTDISVVLTDTNTKLAYTASATPSAVQFSYTNLPGAARGVNVVLDKTLKNRPVKIVYRRELTVREASALFGDQPFARPFAAAFAGSVPVIQSGPVYTDQIDVSANWPQALADATVPVTLADNGRVTVNGTGLDIRPFIQIHAIPTADNPFLGIYINVA